MKVVFKALIMVVIPLLMSCKDDSNEDKAYTLTINNGTGSGSYKAGQVVNISANEPEAGQAFDQWTGSTEHVLSTTSASSTVTMPAANIELTATYKPFDYGTPVQVVINKETKFQTMDGFGFFGARDVWWGSGEAAHFHNEAWLEKIIADLGITVWRNELYPHVPPSGNSSTNQDANWSKQKPMVQALKAKADQHKVDLKVILTAWTPPAIYKWAVSHYEWAGDEDATRQEGNVSEKNGGTLNPNKYNEFAQWWIDAIQMYKDIGVDVYAISLQNEPMFSQPFNSAIYTNQWYVQMLNSVVPLIKQAHPDVKVFGSENMLVMEGKDINYPYFYHNAFKQNATAMQNLDIFAVHGYQDGVSASSGSELAAYWTNHKEQFTHPTNKKAWMTETSGYYEHWEKQGKNPGAFSLAIDLQTALNFGDVSAWVFWQGSGLPTINEFSLMADVTVGKKYYVSKNFYRFIRPGAVRLSASTNDTNIAITTFEHIAHGTHTIVLTNTSESPKPVTISGTSLPSEYEMFVTSSTKNCESQGVKSASDVILLPARSVVTLQAGGSVLGNP